MEIKKTEKGFDLHQFAYVLDMLDHVGTPRSHRKS